MPAKPIDIHARAAFDAGEARRWYRKHSPPSELRFVDELRDALREVGDDPARWPRYLYGTQVYKLPHFPYLVVYADRGAFVRIAAVAHTSRRPGYWRRRLP